MARNIEYNSYKDAERIAILENRAAELERRLLEALPPDGRRGRGNVATPPDANPVPAEPSANVRGRRPAPLTAGPVEAGTAAAGPVEAGTAESNTVRYAYEIDAYTGDGAAYGGALGDRDLGDDNPGDDGLDDDDLDEDDDGTAAPAGRTEALINHGRSRARPARSRRILAHWRMITAAAVALLAGIITILVVVGSGGPGWPASVATVQAEIKQACGNPDVAAEPSGLNFACSKETLPVLWVFSLLTSGDSPGFVDQSTGRKGLEPIQPAQGGDIAWSLNLHHPYDPGNPIDSLQVAARAINNIISGATLTSTNGGALVEPGLESKAANCARYTGSASLATRAGYPARCAAPLTAPGEAALVSDVFQQWMGGTPSRIAQQAGLLFQNAGNPGDPRVQAILSSLPASGG